MFSNYLRVAFRNLIKNPLYSAINVAGLAVGLAACILISLFVRDELSYDRDWAHAESLYRLNTTFSIPGREPFVTVLAQGPTKHALENDFSEDIAAVTRFQSQHPVIKYHDKAFSEEVYWTDPETADMFDLDVIAGDLAQTLNDNASLAINQSFAIKYFGDTSVIGEVVNIRVAEMNRDFRIGAVFRDLPHNTVLDFQALAMIDEGDWQNQPYLFEHWFSVNNRVFFQLKPTASIDVVNSRLAEFTDKNIKIPEGSLAEQGVVASDFIWYTTQALTDIQLHPAGLGEMKPTGDKKTVAIFAAIACLTLLIACINFMNLATSRSTQRAREVALRKVLGARRGQLILQFLGESVLIALVGLLVGVVLVEFLLPAYSNFLGRELAFSYSDGFTLAVLAVLVITVGLVGGVYPALVLSGFRPARVLKANKSAESKGSAALRNALVVFQFTISIALIVATATVYGQMMYATSMDPGFNKDQLLSIAGTTRQGVANQQDALKQELLALPDVVDVSVSSETPFSSNENNETVQIPGNPEAGPLLLGNVHVDYDFVSTLEVSLVAGRDYSREYALDVLPDLDSLDADEQPRGNMLVNEAAVRRLGFGTPQQAVGRELILEMGDNDNPREGLFTIIGVLEDMNMQSLKAVIRPEMYLLSPKPESNFLVRFRGDPSAAGEAVESLWNAMFPDVPLSYRFVDEVAAEEFTQERNMATMLGTFSALAVIIACLGLYGLASFTAERRTREIGIRRVLGAGVSNIVGLLLWQFSKPVLLANLIAWPIAVWSMTAWLENFPYRLDTWVLAPLCVVAGGIALLISWLTVGGNAARVARRNPVHALRYE